MALCRIFIQVFVAIGLFVCFGSPASAGTQEKNACIKALEKPALVKIDGTKDHKYSGLTAEGLREFKEARDSLRERFRLFENELRNLTTVHLVGSVARLTKGNMFLYGPPGGAKSAFVNWLMRGEQEKPFKLQLHQMITEQAFTGGQNFEAAKEGRFEVNTEDSLVTHTIALIDEMEKGNPAALASLLSLLNEREALLGNQVVKARLETLFATSNANLPEIVLQFEQNGMGSTAPALLNRLQFKAFVYNWLSKEDQAILDERNERRRYLKSLAKTHPEVLNDEIFLEPKKVEWESVRQIGSALFKSSALMMVKYREFVGDMRELTIRAVRESEQKHKQNHNDEPFVYFPSADYTERLRQQIPEVIEMSAMVDFMLSPLADDGKLELMTAKQIELDPLSLWRGFIVMTTVGPGHVKLKYDEKAEQKLDIDFDWSIDPSMARDEREELLIKNVKDEQERFRRTFLKHIADIQKQIELSAKASGNRNTPAVDDTSFEILLLRSSGS